MVRKAFTIKMWHEAEFLLVTAKILRFVASRLEKRARSADWCCGQRLGYGSGELAALVETEAAGLEKEALERG